MGWFGSSSSREEEEEVMVMAEEEVHTASHPYCGDLNCWCHTDVSYHEAVTHPEPTPEEVEASFSFFGLQW